MRQKEWAKPLYHTENITFFHACSLFLCIGQTGGFSCLLFFSSNTGVLEFKSRIGFCDYALKQAKEQFCTPQLLFWLIDKGQINKVLWRCCYQRGLLICPLSFAVFELILICLGHYHWDQNEHGPILFILNHCFCVSLVVSFAWWEQYVVWNVVKVW